MNFSQALAESYSMHPAFQFKSSLAVSKCQHNVDEFNRSYQFLAGWPCPTPCERQKNFETSKKSLREIFKTLTEQAADHNEKRFLEELEAEILRNLESDYSILGKRAKTDFWTRWVFRKHKRYLAELIAERFFIDRLPEGVVKEILDIGKDRLAEFHKRAQEGKLTREDLSFNSGPEAAKIQKLLHKEFDKLGVIDAVSEYMQQPFEAAGQSFELSVSQAQWWRNGFHGLSRTPDTLYAHLDESIGVPKAIVYLSSVSLDNGPTGYYEGLYEELQLNPIQEMVGRVLANVGNEPNSPLRNYYNKSYHQSMTSEHFRHHFMRLPPEMRFNSHFGWDIMPDTQAESLMKEREKKMTGPAGTFIVFDGSRLLHRGGLVKQGARVALQVVFNPTRPEKIWKRIFRQYFS